MTAARAAAYLGGATVLAAWLANAAGISRPPRPVRAAPRQTDEVVLGRIVADVQAQAVRLRQRLAVAPTPRPANRNPFSFDVREPAARPRPAARPAASRPDPVTAPERFEPVLSLLGIAEQQTAAGMVRTAVVSGDDDELQLLVEGQEVAGRYRVTAVGADVVELTDLVTGATRRLVLKSPAARP